MATLSTQENLNSLHWDMTLPTQFEIYLQFGITLAIYIPTASEFLLQVLFDSHVVLACLPMAVTSEGYRSCAARREMRWLANFAVQTRTCPSRPAQASRM